MGLRVLIADDHKIIREGLRSLIEQQPDMEVVDEAEHGQAAVRQALRLNPDVVVMDIGMPHLNGIEATRQILSQRPDIHVIGLSIHSDRQFVASMMEAGADAYLLKDCAFEELIGTIRLVAAKRAGGRGPSGSRRSLPGTVSGATLTQREREVLRLIADGESTRQIAEQLGVTLKTIEAHRRSLMDKLQVHSIAQLTKYALREGLTSLED